MGEEEQWRSVRTYNMSKDLGKKGYDNLRLEDKEYTADSDTDLLMHFNRRDEKPGSGYKVIRGHRVLQESGALGGIAASFTDASGSLEMMPRKGSLLAPGNRPGDFSIEFRLLPNDLSRRENVFYWKNVRIVENRLNHQYVSCSIKNRQVQWDFINFFTPDDLSELTISLQSRTRLIPGSWSHHLISFDSSSGMLKYSIDGSPEAIRFVTRSGREKSVVLRPSVGDNPEGLLHLGRVFNGLMDELRISRRVVSEPFLDKFSRKRGVVLSRPIDLNYTNTRLVELNSRRFEPDNSSIFYYYRFSNDRRDQLLWEDDRPDNYADGAIGPEWTPFEPGRSPQGTSKGRYLQLLMELYPDGKQSLSPILKSVSFTYQEDLPPIPPGGVTVDPQNGHVRISWNPVTDTDLAGYLIYFGDSPGSYFGKAGDLKSPIDVGDVNQFRIENLKNGKLYFFSIVAYDNSYKVDVDEESATAVTGTNNPHKSDFSVEVSARPSRIYGVGE